MDDSKKFPQDVYKRQEHTYSDLASEIYLNSGGISLSVTSFPNLEEPEKFTGAFTASARVRYEKLDFGFSLIGEMLADSILDDEKRLCEIVAEMKSRSQAKLNSAAHSAACLLYTSCFHQFFLQRRSGRVYQCIFQDLKCHVMDRIQVIAHYCID